MELIVLFIEVPPVLHNDGLQALGSALASAYGRDEAVVLRGRAEMFCAGMDLEALAQPPGHRAAAVLRFAELLIGLRFAPAPVLAVVDGPARGGGLGLVAASDWVVGTPASQYSLPELPLGLRPATVMPLVLERVTPIAARQLALRATTIDATEAKRLGLVDEVVDTGSLACCIRRRVRALHRGRASTVSSIKRLCADDRLEAAIRAGASQTARDLCNPNIVEPIREFLAGGVPPWSRP